MGLQHRAASCGIIAKEEDLRLTLVCRKLLNVIKNLSASKPGFVELERIGKGNDLDHL